MQGSIHVIFGPMFSGKSSEMLRRIRRFSIAKKSCLVIKYRKDTRYSVDSVATHDCVTCSARGCEILAEMDNIAHQFDVIGVDEGQFFPDVVEYCEKWADRGITVVVAALDGTFQRKGFNSILELVPIAESVEKLSAVCMGCGAEAAFSKRIVSGDAVEMIGGADKYVAVCRSCFHDRTPKEVQSDFSLDVTADSPIKFGMPQTPMMQRII